MQKKGNFEEAATLYQAVVSGYAHEILADDALFKLADLQEMKFKNKDKAMELYQNLMVNYPSSIYIVEARKRYRALRGDQVN